MTVKSSDRPMADLDSFRSVLTAYSKNQVPPRQILHDALIERCVAQAVTKAP